MTQTDAQFQNVTHPASHMAFAQAQISVPVRLAGKRFANPQSFVLLNVTNKIVCGLFKLHK